MNHSSSHSRSHHHHRDRSRSRSPPRQQQQRHHQDQQRWNEPAAAASSSHYNSSSSYNHHSQPRQQYQSQSSSSNNQWRRDGGNDSSQQYHQQPQQYHQQQQQHHHQHQQQHWNSSRSNQRGNNNYSSSSSSHSQQQEQHSDDVILTPPIHVRRRQVDEEQAAATAVKSATAAVVSATAAASSSIAEPAAAASSSSSSGSTSSHLGKFAFVTLVMIGDAYVPGALVLAHSIRTSGSQADLVVMVSPDVSAAARADLQLVFTRVVEIDYISGRAIHREWTRYTRPKDGSKPKMYQWLDKSYTKFRVLGLEGYEKVCLLDADTLCVKNPDDVFAIVAPAGICSTITSIAENASLHNRKLTEAQVMESWKSYGMRGCFYLLQPNNAHLDLIQSMLKQYGGYGERKYHIGADEKLMTDLYLDQWTHVHFAYGCNSWKCTPDVIGRDPVFLHYVTEKPWLANEIWPDTLRWNEFAQGVIQAHPQVKERFTVHLDAIEKYKQQKGLK